MIFESQYWKEDLARRSMSLKKRCEQRRWPERSFALVEQELMLGFYSVRKLLESNKLSQSVSDLRLSLCAHPCKNKAVTQLNRHAVDDLYDLGGTASEERDLAFVCNQFIHSYVFVLTFAAANEWDGVLVSSDRERNRVAYYLPTGAIIELFDIVASDSPNIMVMSKNERRGDFDVVVGSNTDGHNLAFIAADEQEMSDDAVATMIKSALLRGLPTVSRDREQGEKGIERD